MDKRTIGIEIVVALVAAMVFAGTVSATPSGAATDINVSGTTKTVTAESDSAQGGYITGLNLTSEQSTEKWQGYFGNISGSIVLEDGSGHQMYTWGSVVSGGGEVFATTSDSAPTWSAVNSVLSFELADQIAGMNANWGWDDTSDDADATFSTTGTVTVAGTVITETVATATNAMLPAGHGWQTLVITDAGSIFSKDDYIFVGLIHDNTAGYRGSTVDYEIIVATPDTGELETYNFYMELS